MILSSRAQADTYLTLTTPLVVICTFGRQSAAVTRVKNLEIIGDSLQIVVKLRQRKAGHCANSPGHGTS